MDLDTPIRLGRGRRLSLLQSLFYSLPPTPRSSHRGQCLHSFLLPPLNHLGHHEQPSAQSQLIQLNWASFIVGLTCLRQQSMSELKLRRLTEHNQRLREDLTRPRVRVSEASARYVPPLAPSPNYSMVNRVLQSHSVLQNHQRPFGMSRPTGVQPLTPSVAVARVFTRVSFFPRFLLFGGQ